jgi:beta-1,4-mannosyltransferase
MLTGKGPLKEYYESIFIEKNFKNIKVHFVWLEPNDYPILLGIIHHLK